MNFLLVVLKRRDKNWPKPDAQGIKENYFEFYKSVAREEPSSAVGMVSGINEKKKKYSENV